MFTAGPILGRSPVTVRPRRARCGSREVTEMNECRGYRRIVNLLAGDGGYATDGRHRMAHGPRSRDHVTAAVATGAHGSSVVLQGGWYGWLSGPYRSGEVAHGTAEDLPSLADI